MTEIKLVASRFLLPVEFLLGVYAIAWACSGGMGKGLLHEFLREHGDSTTTWMVVLSAVGVVHCGAAAFEWVNGRYWQFHQLLWSAKVRTSVAFIGILAWLWVIKMMVDTSAWQHVFVLILIAPATVAMEAWVCWENYRVRLAVDSAIPTSTMRFRR